jgi:hypothetical protein
MFPGKSATEAGTVDEAIHFFTPYFIHVTAPAFVLVVVCKTSCRSDGLSGDTLLVSAELVWGNDQGNGFGTSVSTVGLTCENALQAK